MTIVKLRTEVLDERGRLGALASAIAAYGGNILGIDVHLLDGAHVADEFVIEFAGDHVADGLGTSLRRAGGAPVLFERLEAHVVVDPVVRAVDLCAQLFGPGSSERRLEGGAAELVGADAAALLDWRAMDGSPFLRRAREDGVPVVGRDRALESPAGGDVPWVLVIPDGAVAATRWLVLQRAAPAFSSSEMARVAALLRVAHAAEADARALADRARDSVDPPRPIRRAPASFFRPRPAPPALQRDAAGSAGA
jgi:hypothetical protein